MRCILLLTIIFLSSCGNKKETTEAKQQAVKNEMEQVKAFYYKKLDSLGIAKDADTSSAKRQEIAEALAATEQKKTAELLVLQKKYDSLDVALKK